VLSKRLSASGVLMANDLRTIFRLGQDTALRERALAAIMRKAVLVAGHPDSTDAARAFARNIVLGPEQFVAPLVRVLSVTPGMVEKVAVQEPSPHEYSLDSSAITDDEIAAVCETCWAALAPPTPVPEPAPA
jgi:hypothetical protein